MSKDVVLLEAGSAATGAFPDAAYVLFVFGGEEGVGLVIVGPVYLVYGRIG